MGFGGYGQYASHHGAQKGMTGHWGCWRLIIRACPLRQP